MQKLIPLAIAATLLAGCDSEGINRVDMSGLQSDGSSSGTDANAGQTGSEGSGTTDGSGSTDSGSTGSGSTDSSSNNGSTQNDGADTTGDTVNQFGGSGSSDGGTSDSVNQFGGSGSSDGGDDGGNGDVGTLDDGSNNTGDASGADASLNLSEPTTGTTFVSTMSPIRSEQNSYSITPSTDENGNVVMNGNCPVVQFHPNLKFGDFLLATNAWNFCASSLPDWTQTISVNDVSGNVVPRWDYDWGNESDVRGAVWLVKSYPEIIYGVKSPGEYSGPTLAETPAATGMPVRVDELPFYKIDYAFSSEEYPTRSKDFNGQTLNGERNVAVESFFHELGGNCDVSTLVRNGTTSNQRFEIMLWLDRGAERLPAAPGDYVTSVSLDGKSYDVYTKPSDLEYIAFVAQNPQSSGEINWNTFIEWTRTYSHRVNEAFGRGSNTVQLQDSWCMANILVGTEIWWGNGYFQADNWTIHRTVQ